MIAMTMTWRTLVTTTLDLYVLRRFLYLYGATLFCFTLVYVLIDSFENLDDFAEQTDTFHELLSFSLRYYLATVPVVFCQLLGPIVALTAGLFTVTLFQRVNEFVPMLANGRPYWRIFLPIFVAGGVISVATFCVQEFWIPRQADVLREVEGKKKGLEILENRNHLDRMERILIMAKRYHVVEKRAEGVTVMPLPLLSGSRDDQYEYYIQAPEMQWVEPELAGEDSYWMLFDCNIQKYRAGENGGLIPPLPRFEPEFPLRTSCIPADLEAGEQEIYLELGSLRRKMEQSVDHRWALKYFTRFSMPASALVLLFLGLPVITFYGSRNIFFGALVSAVLANAYFLFSSMAGNLALYDVLPASMAAWLGPTVCASLGVTWMRYLR